METVKMVKRLKPYMTICSIYWPYPGTELFNYCIDKGLFKYEERLEKVGRLYGQTINISNVKTEVLLKTKRYFNRRNIYQEIKFILINGKIVLMIYYFIHYMLKSKRGVLKWK